MPKKIDKDRLVGQLRLLLMQRSSISRKDASSQLGVTRSTLMSLLELLGEPSVLTTGASVNTRYSLRRQIDGVETPIPIYQINEAGRSSLLGELHPIATDAFCFISSENHQPVFFADLPYFLDDLRPAGFLGKIIPMKHAELRLPKDPTSWSTNDVLRYLTRFGTNLIGQMVVGATSMKLVLDEVANLGSRAEGVKEGSSKQYSAIANNLLEHYHTGSSPGGERPKFTYRDDRSGKEYLVKFSPKVTHASGRRWADLLIVEHHASTVLRQHYYPAVLSQIIEENDQVFLELERFDRIPRYGRRGVISLSALDSEYSAVGTGWSRAVEALVRVGKLSVDQLEKIVVLECFGDLIANSDMHLGNLSFFCNGLDLLHLTPTYDMTAMMYAPIHEQLLDRPFNPKLPLPELRSHWQKASELALELWNAVTKDPMISKAFRQIAKGNLKKVKDLKALV